MMLRGYGRAAVLIEDKDNNPVVKYLNIFQAVEDNSRFFVAQKGKGHVEVEVINEKFGDHFVEYIQK